jgi:hypothetical protein
MMGVTICSLSCFARDDCTAHRISQAAAQKSSSHTVAPTIFERRRGVSFSAHVVGRRSLDRRLSKNRVETSAESPIDKGHESEVSLTRPFIHM